MVDMEGKMTHDSQVKNDTVFTTTSDTVFGDEKSGYCTKLRGILPSYKKKTILVHFNWSCMYMSNSYLS